MTILWAWLLAAAAAQASQASVKQAPTVAANAHVRVAPSALAPSVVGQNLTVVEAPKLAAGTPGVSDAAAALPAFEAWAAKTDLTGGGAAVEPALSFLYDHEAAEASEVLRLGGDTVPERTFVVGRYLGKGDTTVVHRLADQPHLALRRPRGEAWVETAAGRMPMPWFMDQFIEGHAPLAKAGVPVVGLHDSAPGAFAVVDYVDGPLLKDFLRHPRLFTPIETDKMLKALEVFAAKTAAFATIGDFKSEQLLYDEKRGWVLFDWMANHQLHDAENNGDTFMNVYREKSFNHLDGFDAQARAWIQHVLGVAHGAVARARKAG